MEDSSLVDSFAKLRLPESTATPAQQPPFSARNTPRDQNVSGPSSLVRKLLSHFNYELGKISPDILDNINNISNVSREILEICYSQSLSRSGTLHVSNYFITLGEASLGWPFDADYQSEEYYEHEDRLDSDEGYAKAFRLRCEQNHEKERKNEEKHEEEWISFWVQALNKCADGPTLFYPLASHGLPQWHFTDPPRYLFRAFDSGSSGRSDESIIGSVENSRVDLLSRGTLEATEMLHRHLKKRCFGPGEGNDNLMSWSSSLLFVIQYAIWRCRHSASTQGEVNICAVDTRKFPRGQFVRDKGLLRTYRDSANLDEEMRKGFDFRLETKDYDNGEYLSQGTVHHAGRSCVFSLEQLIQAGLYGLYPEFADSDEKKNWTNRVKALRLRWYYYGDTTTQVDIRQAVKIARACFKTFNTPDVALLLLSLKPRRELQSTPASRTQEMAQRRRQNLDDYGQVEVRRYVEISEAMRLEDRDDGSNPIELLSGGFECT